MGYGGLLWVCLLCIVLQYAGSKDDFAQQTQQDTQIKLVQLVADVDVNKDKVVRRLLEMVYDIKPEIHINCRLVKKTSH